MKVWVDTKSELAALASKIHSDGDELVHDRSKAEVKIDVALKIPSDLLPSFGFQSAMGDPSYTVSRYWAGKSWAEQLIVGVPLLRLMNDNLGPRVCTGMAARFVASFSHEEDFEKEPLQQFYAESNYQGWVTLGYDADQPCEVYTGLPYGLWYNLLESIRGRLSYWIARPRRLLESWTCSLLVSQPPFPSQIQGSRTNIQFDLAQSRYPETEISAHFHHFASGSSRIGYATGWSRSLHDSSERVLNVAKCLVLDDKQYRTDLELQARKVWSEITSKEFV